MSNVVMIPSLPRFGNETPSGDSVTVAPFLDRWATWVHTARGFVLLEYTPLRQHAVDDGTSYARRIGLPLEIRDKPMPVSIGADFYEPDRWPEVRDAIGGEIFVAPCDRAGGSWGVFHTADDGKEELLVWRMTLDAAAEAARRWARTYGATFDEGDDNGGRAA